MLQLAASSILGLTVPHTPHAPPRCLAASRAASPVCVDDKSEVEEYFNNEGFNRWNRIYSEDGEVNAVQVHRKPATAATTAPAATAARRLSPRSRPPPARAFGHHGRPPLPLRRSWTSGLATGRRWTRS